MGLPRARRRPQEPHSRARVHGLLAGLAGGPRSRAEAGGTSPGFPGTSFPLLPLQHTAHSCKHSCTHMHRHTHTSTHAVTCTCPLIPICSQTQNTQLHPHAHSHPHANTHAFSHLHNSSIHLHTCSRTPMHTRTLAHTLMPSCVLACTHTHGHSRDTVPVRWSPGLDTLAWR